MTNEIKYKLPGAGDLIKIKNLLTRAELPVSDIDSKIRFLVAANNVDEPIGCIGVEQYGTEGLLRSFAVEQTYRNKKIGHNLLDELLSLARQSGINNLHLLTTTADRFFSSAGFLLRSREEAPASIKDTTEFSSVCPSSSIYMVMTDIQKKGAD